MKDTQLKYQLIILGSGTSTGTPLLCCECPNCQSLDPKDYRLRTSAAIITPQNKNIIIDTGPDFRQQMIQSQIKNIEAVLYTHLHADHIFGIDDLRAYYFASKQSIPCFLEQSLIPEFKNIFSYIFNPDPRYQNGTTPQLELFSLTNFKKTNIGGLDILPLPLWHGLYPVTGFRMGELAYLTDCNKIPEETLFALKGIKYLVIDGLRSKRNHFSHFTFEEAIEVANTLGVEKTWLIHISHDVNFAKDSRLLPPGVFLAYDQLKIDFLA